MWKEAVTAYFKILSHHLPIETEEDHKNSQPGYPISILRLKAGTS
jgi:hypothetical protein